MERIGLWRLSANAWRDATEVMRRHASLFTLAFIGLLVVYWVSLSLGPVPVTFAEMRADPQAVTRTMPTTLLISALDAVLRVGIVTPCALVAHRFVLIGQEGDRAALDRGRIVRFAVCLLAMTLALLLPSALSSFGGLILAQHGTGAALSLELVGFVLLLCVAVVSVRLALVFPGVAVDRPAPWAASWRMTRSHWWRIVGAFVVCLFVPALVIGLVTSVGRALPHAGAVAVNAIFGGAGSILSATVAAALASWLYRQYGGETGAPAAIW